LTCYFYVKRKAVFTGISLGLTLWARPDAMAFIAAIVIDYLVFLYFKKESREDEKMPEKFSKPDLIKLSISFGVVVILYCGMNMMLSGTLLPNTFSAKTAYYSAEFRSRAGFLRYEVWGYFTSSSYSLLIIPFIIGFIKILYDCFKKRYNYFLLAGLFIFAIIFLYWYKLPFAAVKGRYLIPVIPFYILISVYGAREFFRLIVPYFKDRKIINSLNLILFGIIIVYTALSYFDTRTDYAEQTHHISVRNLAATKWINENTPPDAVIATHDIGAIGYYTRRKLLDVAGLISPQFTPKLFDPDFPKFMADEMKRNNVSYIAFIQEWYRVANENPLAAFGENNEEVLAIYKFEPEKTHVLGRDVNSYLFYSRGLIQNKQYPQAISTLTKLYNADPASSITLFFLGYAYFLSGDAANAEKNLHKALEIFPGYRDASYLLADIYKKENKIEDAKKNISDYLKLNPSDTNAVKLMNTLTDSTRIKK
ncbi:MAG: tetratricopeptide repeat protein, partial [Ignavibacteria bacterium]